MIIIRSLFYIAFCNLYIRDTVFDTQKYLRNRVLTIIQSLQIHECKKS